MAELALLDTDTLSEVMKGRDANVRENARQYLTIFGAFTFSIITRYEILRGLKARNAVRQLARFAAAVPAQSGAAADGYHRRSCCRHLCAAVSTRPTHQ